MTTQRWPSPPAQQLDFSDEVVIVHTNPRAMMSLSAALAGMRYKVTAVDARRAIDAAEPLARRGPLAIIVSLDGSENVVEIRSLLMAAPDTRFLFLASQMPPRAPMARILNAQGATILHQNEAPVVIVSTLVALLSGERPRAESEPDA